MKMIDNMREPIDEHINCRSKFKKWAYDNAYTLIFLSFFFGVTWLIMIVIAAWGATHGH